MEYKVIYVGKIGSNQSKTGFFIYTRDFSNLNMFYGFPETEEIQKLNLKKNNDVLILDGPEGGSISKLSPSIQKELDIIENQYYKWVLLVKPIVTLVHSLKGKDLDLPSISVSVNKDKKRISLYIEVGQKLKEIGRQTGSDRIVEVTNITGTDLEAVIHVKIITSASKRRCASKMTLRNLFRHYSFLD